nr:6086_t:CDS:2 [Entrophospora candida]
MYSVLPVGHDPKTPKTEADFEKELEERVERVGRESMAYKRPRALKKHYDHQIYLECINKIGLNPYDRIFYGIPQKLFKLEVEVGNINSEIENFLKHEVEKYKKKERQCRSIKYSSEQALPKLSNTVTLIDKQDAQKSESSLLCNSNNVASTADIKIFYQKLTNRLKQENLIYLEAEQQKLTNEKDTEISNIKNKYIKLIDENNKNIYILKQKIEYQYESRVSAMEAQNTKNYSKTLEEKNKKIVNLSSNIKRYKKDIESLKETIKSSLKKNKHKIISYNPQGYSDSTIEPEIFYSTIVNEQWNFWCYSNDPEI